MTACADRQPLLHALLDDELDAANVVACEAHVRNCAGCAAELSRLRALRSMLAEPALRHQAPGDLRERIEAALPSATPVRAAPARPPSRLAWTALGAGLSAAASLALFVTTQQPIETGIEHQLVDNHVRSLLAGHLVDVVTSNQHVVKPWFNGRIDFSPPTPDLAAQGFPLAGGRLDYVAGRVVPAIVYRRRLHTINLFVWPEQRAERLTTAHFDGYTVRHWTKDGLEFWAVSDVAPGDLALFQQRFEAAR